MVGMGSNLAALIDPPAALIVIVSTIGTMVRVGGRIHGNSNRWFDHAEKPGRSGSDRTRNIHRHAHACVRSLSRTLDFPANSVSN
jgi:hypothetical protein